MPTTGRGVGARRTNAARLTCGAVLTYEAPTFVPELGEDVPCRRHGSCPVVSREAGDARAARAVSPLPQRRSQSDLIAFLRPRPVTTVHALRRHRFTLRVIAAAQRDGLVDVDLVAGRVALRPVADPTR
jgi:hypothetical protein